MEPNIQDQPQQFKPTGAATSTARATSDGGQTVISNDQQRALRPTWSITAATSSAHSQGIPVAVRLQGLLGHPVAPIVERDDVEPLAEVTPICRVQQSWLCDHP